MTNGFLKAYMVEYNKIIKFIQNILHPFAKSGIQFGHFLSNKSITLVVTYSLSVDVYQLRYNWLA